MRYILLFWFMALGGAVAANDGIRFEHSSWEEVKDKAIKENKLIFADFYTEWCGPCLAMMEDVFPRMEIGNFYNTHFINIKIDAEKGEGLTLSEKYRIKSYPTFLFIDPFTEKVVHRSSSRQEAQTFLFTGKSAICPDLRSTYLEKEYITGKRDKQLLSRYADYLASIYQREYVKKVVEEYINLSDFSLQNPDDWQMFVRHMNGIDNPLFQEVLHHKDKYVILYGQQSVDNKLYREFDSTQDISTLDEAPEFKGKVFLLKKNRAESLIRKQNYQEAAILISELMTDPGEFKEELCHFLKFTARSVLYREAPEFWVKQCISYAQYVAYNSENRQNADIHYDYALLLEKVIKTIPEGERYFPKSVIKQPENGVKNYSLRSPKLKQKPKK